MTEDKLLALLESLRKQAWGKLDSVNRLKEVLDALGGWSVEPFVGLVDLNGKSSVAFMGSQADVEAVHAVALKAEVGSLPSNPVADAIYTMSIGVPKVAWDDEYEVFFKVWYGSWGFKVTSPEGATFELLPDAHRVESLFGYNGAHVDLRNYKKLGKNVAKFLHLYDLPKWLTQHTKFLDQVNQRLGLDAHVPADKRTKENTGSCPCCFRNVKLAVKSGKDLPVMVNHGFKRPGWGYILGNCIGVGFPPFELSPEGTKHLLHKYLQPRLHEQDLYLKRLQAGDVQEVPARGTLTVKKDDPNWDYYYKQALKQTERTRDSVDLDIARLERMLANWKQEPLPEAGKEKPVWK